MVESNGTLDYIEIPVNIPLKVGGDLYQRLAKIAETDDSTIATELSFAVLYGLNQHIRRNLELLEP